MVKRRPVRAEPDGLAARRERAERGRQSHARRLDAAADRRHRPAAQRRRAGRRRSCATSSGSGSRGTRGRSARASGRARYREAAAGARRIASTASRSCARTAPRRTNSRRVVDDVDFGITHIVRGNDHRPNEALHRRLHAALGAEPPEFVHHGLILGPDGKKLAKRAEGATVASLRDAGIPAEAVRALPRGARPAAARRPLRPDADPAGSPSRRSRG